MPLLLWKMSAKIWNKLFKRKSSKRSNAIVKDLPSIASPDDCCDLVTGNDRRSEAAKCNNSVQNGKQSNNNDEIILTPTATIKPVIAEPVTKLDLEPCQFCSRTFVPATLEKHISICQKMQLKKRKVFDSSQQRREGTELINYMPPRDQLTRFLESRVSPPKAMASTLGKKLDSKVSPNEKKNGQNANVAIGRQGRSNSTSSSTAGGEYVRKRSLSKEPVSERCPYCERNFGNRAYDRHVEWCKEKARLNVNNNSMTSPSVAKERLNARIHYKAPSLKTKRSVNRDKYSGFDDVFYRNGKARSEGRHSLSNSMTSSITSESGFSDKYDPFMSAKRQLEELFSPSSPSKNSSNSVSAYNTPILATKTMAKTVAPKATSPAKSQVDSNFRRSMSLRLPKKTSPKPSFISKPQPSTIQRGISDDGPISSNFVKPEEFDEIPVRSVFSKMTAQRRFTPSPPPPPVVAMPILRDPATNINRRNMKLNLNRINLPSTDYPISKTDSLAAFLNYEKDLNMSGLSMTEKEIKDKNNSKLVSVPSLVENDLQSDEENSTETDDKSEDIMVFPLKRTSTPLNYTEGVVKSRSGPIKLSPIDINKINFRMKEMENEEKKIRENFIDPKLINICDNLSISLSKLSDTTSSTESADTMKQRIVDNGSQPSSGEKRMQLKRQMKLNIDHILYNKSPPPSSEAQPEVEAVDPFSEEYDRKLEKVESDGKISQTTLDTYFDDFDFEEFINSFEDDEQNPIFKGYKEMLKSTTELNRQNSDPEDEEDVYFKDHENKEENQIKSPSAPIPQNFEREMDKPVSEAISTPDSRHNDFKFSTDSSYGSLTRQSTPEKDKDSMQTSIGSGDGGNLKLAKMSKFCYECGSEFIVANAKFCMECGVKRVVIQ